MPKSKRKGTLLNEFQRLAAEHYAGGEFSYMTTMLEVERLGGDTLFLFIMRELEEVETMDGAREALDRATEQLKEVADEFEEAACAG